MCQFTLIIKINDILKQVLILGDNFQSVPLTEDPVAPGRVKGWAYLGVVPTLA